MPHTVVALRRQLHLWAFTVVVPPFLPSVCVCRALFENQLVVTHRLA